MYNGKRAVDIAMLLAMPLLMSYELIGQANHEILGFCTISLFILHHMLNRGWHKKLLKGPYSPYRAVLTVINLLMLFLFISQAVCGILMAKHLFPFLPHVSRQSMARILHLLGAYWGFFLCGIHAGMHMTQFLRKRSKRITHWITAVMAAGISVYGGIALLRRGFLRYMTLQEQFVFFDFDEPLALFLLDMFCILILYLCLGMLLGYLLQKPGRKQVSIQGNHPGSSK